MQLMSVLHFCQKLLASKPYTIDRLFNPKNMNRTKYNLPNREALKAASAIWYN